MARSSKAELVAATQSFSLEGGILVRAGDLFRADDPVVLAQPTRFAPPKVRDSREGRPRVSTSGGRPTIRRRPVEQMTAAPGELREVAIPEDTSVGLTTKDLPART